MSDACSSPDHPWIGRRLVSVFLARYITDLGFSAFQVGAIAADSLLGSAALTLVFGLRAPRATPGRLPLAARFVMTFTGIGFAAITAFWPHLIVASPAPSTRRPARRAVGDVVVPADR